MTLTDQMTAIGAQARTAADALRSVPGEQRSAGISAMARHLRANASAILAANAHDVAAATRLVDRLRLDEQRIEAMAASLDTIAALPDVIGEEMARWTPPNGLDIARVRTPIGVIGMIYESRPNVTADAAAICLRSANVVILRPGSEAFASCVAINDALQAGLAGAGLPPHIVQLVPTPDREAVGMMLEGLNGAIELIIPRGGAPLVERVTRESKVPTLGHLEGLCHTYVHASADPDMAVAITVNAKMRRTSVCGATETLLIDRDAAPALLPRIAAALGDCELRGDEEARAIVPMIPATKADWSTEYLGPILAVRTVAGLDEAIAHIRRYGTGHTEAIIAADPAAADTFLDRVDAAIVIWNASTQFADGGEFGFGGEIGIATGKLHARGPVGPEQLTSFKYKVRGAGRIRP
ncbi:glutamate-5-semialdehyde dehydrogenase [Sphingomonas sp.]|uniref:glutamate-5-semialdehyde dehydrogenase n=1 Tax=Sphingomonas sp. TaxID=28214 RepID=UPI0025EE65A3|nr:glutamate-5-semialdehyde dehydrogenase [Sphingomonas sp.]